MNPKEIERRTQIGHERMQWFTAAKQARGSWDTLFDEVSTYVLPNEKNILSPRKITQGQPNTIQLFDTTAVRSNEKLSSGLYSYLCPPYQKWFSLSANPKETPLEKEDRIWLDSVTQTLHEEFSRGNFREAAFTFLLSLGGFCTACLFVDYGQTSAFNFVNYPIRNVFFLENNKGVIDTVFVLRSLSARQAEQEFGAENLPERVLKQLENIQSREEETEYLQIVYPRRDRDPRRKDSTNMPIASDWVSTQDAFLIRESGFEEMPFLISRFYKATGEIMGRGPGIDLLPEIKMLNRMRETFIKAAEKVVDPPLLLPNDGSVYPMTTSPKGFIYYDPQVDPRNIMPLQTSAQIGITLEVLKYQQEIIMQGFFVDLFQALVNRQNMTAREVIERVDEKMMLLGPTVGRLQTEFFTPLIWRCLGILERKRLVPPRTPTLQEAPLKIEFIGKLALSQKFVEGEALSRTIQQFAPILTVDPTLLDNVDRDIAFRETAINNGMPNTWLKDRRQVMAERQQRQEAMAVAQGAQTAKTASQAVRNLQRPTEQGSPLQQLVG